MGLGFRVILNNDPTPQPAHLRWSSGFNPSCSGILVAALGRGVRESLKGGVPMHETFPFESLN